MFIFRNPFGPVLFDDDKGGGGGDKGPVPYERFADVTQKLKDANEKLAAREAELATAQQDVNAAKAAQTKAEQALADREREGLPEKDRLQATLQAEKERADAAEARAAQAETDRVNLEREGWVRAAAAAANFHDPEDAVLRVKLDDIRTADAAKREVERIATAETTKHLVKPAESGDPAPSAGDLLSRVLERGERVSENGNSNGSTDTKPVIPADQFNSLNTDKLVALQETDPDLYARSLAAASATSEE